MLKLKMLKKKIKKKVRYMSTHSLNNTPQYPNKVSLSGYGLIYLIDFRLITHLWANLQTLHYITVSVK